MIKWCEDKSLQTVKKQTDEFLKEFEDPVLQLPHIVVKTEQPSRTNRK